MKVLMCWRIIIQSWASKYGRCGPHHLSITQTKPGLFYFSMAFFLPYIQPIAMLWNSATQRGQNHWRSKNQIVERLTYHPKQK